MMKMIVTPEYLWGVDPGLEGGLAFVSLNDADKRGVYKMPIKPSRIAAGNEVDTAAVWQLFLKHHPHTVFIEKQQTVHARGAIKNGMNMGRLVALCELSNAPFDLVAPVTWESRMIPDWKEKSRKEKKEWAIEYAQSIGFNIPTLKPTGQKLHDGCADAVCILAWMYSIVTPGKL